MYFIEDGKISIQISQDGGEVEISQLGTGQYFGELALVTHRPRAASAYAMENCKVACMYLIFIVMSICFSLLAFSRIALYSHISFFIKHFEYFLVLLNFLRYISFRNWIL